MLNIAKIEQEKEKCIGCAACEGIAPDHWKMNDDNKADIVGGKVRKDGWDEKEIDDKDLEINKEAASICPVQCIHVKE